MSDRAIPRSYRMMEGFGVHTFRFVNEEGKAHFVKFHWKPVLGVHSLVWDEAQTIAGKDPDYHRRDLWEAIERGDEVEYELGVQMIDEEDEFKFDFDILDPTKLWPEEIVPVKIIGKMTLNRNQDNVFAETEQAAFHPGHVVPGIDFTNDPLLQGRLFSYTDTQLIRLGGPNFHEIPINRPVCPFHNNQYDGYHRMTINKGPVAYHKNSLQNNDPAPASEEEGGYVHYEEKVEGKKIRQRSESFNDHYSQAKLFWNSMSPVEKEHIISAFRFEVGKVKSKDVRRQVVHMFNRVDGELAKQIAAGVGVEPPEKDEGSNVTFKSPALSQENTVKLPQTRTVAILAEQGFDDEDLSRVLKEFKKAGIIPDIVSSALGVIEGAGGTEIEVGNTLQTVDSVLYDAVYIPGGQGSIERLKLHKAASDFVNEAFGHYKAVGAAGEGVDLLLSAAGAHAASQPGIITSRGDKNKDDFGKKLVEAISGHRHWDRQV
ncbi:Catalase HPII [Bacillus licheniformis]|nr:Catalase HPII [Bacillus licheniformis]TWN18643.1 Catalase HPII [Bacillus licheniformis]TWN25519.1 Catalase HPII [Bacillus licheniformis]